MSHHHPMTDRINEGIRYLAEQFSCDKDEFRRDNQPQGEMLLDGLLSKGFARVGREERIVATEAGRRRLKDSEVSNGQDD